MIRVNSNEILIFFSSHNLPTVTKHLMQILRFYLIWQSLDQHISNSCMSCWNLKLFRGITLNG